MQFFSLKRTFLALLALSALNIAAVAGPGQVFQPLTSKNEISSLKPGTSMAVECPHCGTIVVSKVGFNHKHAAGFTCPACKMKIVYSATGSGKGTKGMVGCVDEKTGRNMAVRVCAVH
jgi:transposase-like protein